MAETGILPEGGPTGHARLDMTGYLKSKVDDFHKSVQYKPWYIKLSLLDRRLLAVLFTLPFLLLLIIILAVTLTRGSDCVDSPQDYRGVYSSTSTGLPCVDWSSTNKSIHSVLPDRYAGADLTGNFCRDPDDTGRVWCYTSTTADHYDYCDIPKCANAKAPSKFRQDFRYKPDTDTACVPEVSLEGFEVYQGRGIDGKYEITNTWINGRGVFRRSLGGGRICISWHAAWRHWWITGCASAGKNQGQAWLEEDGRCPYSGSAWRRGGTDQPMRSARVLPVTRDLVNCLEFDTQYKGQTVTEVQADREDGEANEKAEAVKLSTGTYLECRGKCFQHPTCKAFTWSKRSGDCALLHTVTEKTSNPELISGAYACSKKVKVGCPKDSYKLGNLCLKFLEASNSICAEGCSRFRAMEECELDGGYLVDDITEEMTEPLFNHILVNYGESEWWTSGSDMSKQGRFTWETSGDDVPTSPALWRNSSVPLVADGGAGHYCVILARDKAGIKFDQSSCDLARGKPLCAYRTK